VPTDPMTLMMTLADIGRVLVMERRKCRMPISPMTSLYEI
jgi:hypothetical protein